MPLDALNGISDTFHPLTHDSIIPSLQSEELDLEALRAIVSRTRGYYARDYSMTLGWNNVRSITASFILPYHTNPHPDALHH